MKAKKPKYEDFDVVFENTTWKVKMVNSVSGIVELDGQATECYGLCDYRKKEITVCYKDHSIQDVKVTLGHELGHMILHLLDMASNRKYDPELAAELIGRGLAQVAWQLPKWFYTL